jgi:hypothetical protein
MRFSCQLLPEQPIAELLDAIELLERTCTDPSFVAPVTPALAEGDVQRALEHALSG